ncbi:30S ribosomal protein S16 [Magnetococcales bacterium HHB-1]
MAVKIRLQRRGSKKRPFYAVVAADRRMPRDGRFLEKIGTYDPNQKGEKRISLVRDRVDHWISKGAKPSDVVTRLIKDFDQLKEAAAAEPMKEEA